MMLLGSPLAMSCADAHAPPLRFGERSASLRVGGDSSETPRAGVFLVVDTDAEAVGRSRARQRTKETYHLSLTLCGRPPIDGRFLPEREQP